MATYRFVFSAHDNDKPLAFAVTAASLPHARKIIKEKVKEDSPLISTNIRNGQIWSVIEGEEIIGTELRAHPNQPNAAIDVQGDAYYSYNGQDAHDPMPTVGEAKSIQGSNTSTSEQKNTPYSANNVPASNSSLPEHESSAMVTTLWCVAGLVAFGTLVYLTGIDYRYLSTEMTSLIVTSALFTNLFFVSITVAMSYLHKISVNTRASNIMLRRNLEYQNELIAKLLDK